jgi:hypothetical protein
MHIFVGHAFTEKKMDDLRESIGGALSALPNFELKPVYADQVVGSGHILDKIKTLIAQSVFCIFDITENDRPNIYFELGFAHGIRKPHFLICQSGAKIPSDLAGYEYLAYNSYKHLREELTQKFPHYMSFAFNVSPKTKIGDLRLLKPIFERLSKGRTRKIELVEIGRAAGFTEDDLNHSLAHLAESVIKFEKDELFIAPDGQRFVDMVLAK